MTGQGEKLLFREEGVELSLDDVYDAREIVSKHAKVTPVFTNSTISGLCGRELFFKMEVFQKTGSFKIRGALNAIFSMTDEQAKNGVVTHSSGNHAQATALAAKLRGIPAYIVVPENAPKVKVAAIKGYGGNITFCGLTMQDREDACNKIQREKGSHFVAPFNAKETICGQATIGLELMEQTELGLDAIVVPISGGGMISGIALAAKSLNPKIKIIAAEPRGVNDAADAHKSKAAGALQVDAVKPKTLADGLQAKMGNLTWAVVRDLVDDVVVVEEAEIVSAMQLVYERMKVVVEPSGAVGVAAALSEEMAAKFPPQSFPRVGVVLCGGNADFSVVDFWANWTKRWQSF
ncbi:serine/threonine dehydratase [Chloropicon roscoffensis]|uniref:Serine racemase n=2 Tax=Chloropicon roscoffensis TaxID=1461544 RepID=A0AAX4P722_9CHLO